MRCNARVRALTRISTLLVLLLGLTACAQSPFSGYDQAGPETERAIATAAAQGRATYSPDATAQIAIVQNPDINAGRLTTAAMMKIQQYNISCQKQVGPQMAGPVQSTLGSAVPYGAAGVVGTGVGAHVAFGAAAAVGTYGAYGGITEFALGGINGALTGSYAMASAIGTCTRDFWEDVVHTNPLFAGAHVEVVYYGKRWFGSAPPALEHAVPYATGVQPAAYQPAPVEQSQLPPVASQPPNSTAPVYMQVPPNRDLPGPDDVVRRAGATHP